MVEGRFIEMQTDIMRNYPPTDAQKLLDIYNASIKMKEHLDEMSSKAYDSYIFIQLKDIVENYYDIGKLVDVYQIFGGYVNTSFGIYTKKNGNRQTWFVRKYKKGKVLDSLLFEHNMLLHARKKGFTYGAIPIMSKDGKTYHETTEITPEGEIKSYFAIFTYIGGKAMYDWIPNWANENVEDITITSAAKCLAEFHSSTFNFDPEGRHGDNIMDSEDITVNEIMRKFPERLKSYRQSYSESGFENSFTEYYDVKYDFISKMSNKSIIPDKDYYTMLSTVCHCDFHPGNLKYLESGEVCGSFDYDMAKIDSRLFDLGLAIHYCFASWLPDRDGVINMRSAILFIDTYNEEIRKLNKIEPLSEIEKKYLYEVTLQGTLYAFGWCSSACVYNPELDPYEYRYYAEHLIACLEWLEENEEDFRKAFDK